MTPTAALERALHCLERSFENGFKTKAFVRALDVVRNAPAAEIEARAAAGTLTELDGIGGSTATVISEALAGSSTYLDRLEASTVVPVGEAGRP